MKLNSTTEMMVGDIEFCIYLEKLGYFKSVLHS